MSRELPNIIFMSTPEFGVPILQKVHEELGVAAVVTIPDRPQGRGRKLVPSPVCQAAVKLDIPVLKPEKLKDDNFIYELANLEPDIILVVAFRILPPEVFTLAKLGTFNIHASLLPKLRGAAPINRAIINGEKQTGLTTFLIDRTVDTGNLVLQEAFDLPDHFTAGDLHDYMMPLAADIGVRTCRMLISGEYTPLKQDDSKATPAPKIFTEQSIIDWSKSSLEIKRFVHGFSPVPGARTLWNGKILKLLRLELTVNKILQTGEFMIIENSMFVGTGDFDLRIIELQPEGKKALPVKDFINGYRGEDRGNFQ